MGARALRFILRALARFTALLASVLGVAALVVWGNSGRAERLYRESGRFVTVADGQRLHYSDSGRGAPGARAIVLLHGNPGTIHDFDRLIPLLSRGRRVVAFDRPGHGYSDRSGMSEATPAAQARAIHAALTELRVDRPILIGHSWGGALAMAYAMEFPADVSGLVLVGTRAYPVDGPPDPLYSLLRTPVVGPLLRHTVVALFAHGPIESRVAAAYRPDSVQLGHVARARALWSRPAQLGATVWDTYLLQHAADTMSRRYTTLTHPTMLVVGDSDELLHETERLSRDLPGSWIRVLPNTGHYAIRTRPTDVARAIAELEARLSALSRPP